jgi:hypothetical protein
MPECWREHKRSEPWANGGRAELRTGVGLGPLIPSQHQVG